MENCPIVDVIMVSYLSLSLHKTYQQTFIVTKSNWIILFSIHLFILRRLYNLREKNAIFLWLKNPLIKRIKN